MLASAGNGSTGVLPICAMAVVVVLLLHLRWGLLGPGHFFGPANNNSGGMIKVVISHSP